MSRDQSAPRMVRRVHLVVPVGIVGGLLAAASLVLAVQHGAGHTRVHAAGSSAAATGCPASATVQFGAQLLISPCSGLADAQTVSISGSGFGAA